MCATQALRGRSRWSGRPAGAAHQGGPAQPVLKRLSRVEIQAGWPRP